MIRSLSLLLLTLPAFAVASVSVSQPSCSGDISLSSFDYNCGGSSCSLGSTVYLSGVVTSYTGLSDEVQATINICTDGSCSQVYNKEISLCDHLTSNSDDCPDAGSYAFSTTSTIPKPDVDSFQMQLIMTDGDDFGAFCSLQVSSSDSSDSASSSGSAKKKWYSVFTGSFVGAALLTIVGFGLRQRKTRPLICLGDDKNDRKEELMPKKKESNFEMMPPNAAPGLVSMVVV